MTTFLRLLNEKNKAAALLASIKDGGDRVFTVDPSSFRQVPAAPFAYWVSEEVRSVFRRLPALEANGRTAQHGCSTKDDSRFLRLWWEISGLKSMWVMFAKGGAYSPFYSDIYLVVNWGSDARELEAALLKKYPYLGETANWVLHRECKYLHPGLTWSSRTNGLSLRLLPADCIFTSKGPAVFAAEDDHAELLSLASLMNSQAFGLLVSVQLARVELAQSFEVGLIQQTPVPALSTSQLSILAGLARHAWALKRTLDTIEETSHAFALPAVLRPRLGDYDPPVIEAQLASIQSEIDDIAFGLYGFSEADRAAVQASRCEASGGDAEAGADDESDEEVSTEPIPQIDGLMSWAVGVAFGRFDWRLASGERAAPPEPEPFDPLPAKSPGMLPDGAAPFHAHAGILVDDAGHPHDLVRLTEEVLARVDVPVPADLRRWLQKDFFVFHLQRYSKSRRKAPIYWPLSTVSGSYTLWVYYPSLSRQTLYTAINDFVEPKLKQVDEDVTALRNKGGARTRDDEKQFETLQILAQELNDLRDTMQSLAHGYQPDHDDGVQITAAPLWTLFRHKPWQKLLKDTFAKLQKGDYDWAHLAMTYWPDRVREKCKTDKSLAIAHGLEELYVEPEATPKKSRGRKKADT